MCLVLMSLICQHNNKPSISSSGAYSNYRQTSNTKRTESPNLNISRLILQLSFPNVLKPGVKSRMKMYLMRRRQAMLQLHVGDQQFIAH